VKFHTSANVNEILVEAGKAVGIKLENGAEYKSDFVVSGADYHHTEATMLKEKSRNYSDDYWEKRTMAPSSILYYVGLNKRIDGILHHTLFFDTDFEKHAGQIYDKPEWPDEPLFYVSATSVTDSSVAPEGCENIFILIPTAPGLMDDQKIKDQYFELVMKRMEDTFEQNIRDHVIFRRDFACSDFMQDYNSFKGNAYGLANTLNQTAVLKPSLKNKRVKNLYYTGQLTVPGPGVPPSLISGAVVAKEVMKAS
jgi:phytoene desaturase